MTNKSYAHLRQLTREITGEEQQSIAAALLQHDIELQIKTGKDKYQLITTLTELPEGAFYVSAADMEYARELASQCINSLYGEDNGAKAAQAVERVLCSEQQAARPENEEDGAMQAYIRRQRFTYMQWGIVLAVFLIYMIIRVFLS